MSDVLQSLVSVLLCCCDAGIMALCPEETAVARGAASLSTEGPKRTASSPAPCTSSATHRTARCMLPSRFSALHAVHCGIVTLRLTFRCRRLTAGGSTASPSRSPGTRPWWWSTAMITTRTCSRSNTPISSVNVDMLFQLHKNQFLIMGYESSYFGFGIPSNRLTCTQGQKHLFSYNMHLFLPYLLNDS